MARQSEFVQFVLELLAPVGGVRARAMFGGFGIYQRDTIFAIVVDDRLYFRVDDATRPKFTALGLNPFTYVARGKAIAMQYYEAPPEVFDAPEVMCSHALDAVGAALRARNSRKKTPA